MKLPNWLKSDKPGATVTIELEVKNMKDLDRLERGLRKFADDMERAADAGERLALAMTTLGLSWPEEDPAEDGAALRQFTSNWEEVR